MKPIYDIVLVDRDNTLNFASKDEASPFYYISRPEHLILKPGTKEAMNILCFVAPMIILVTKQRGVSKRKMTINMVVEVNEELEKQLGLEFTSVLIETEEKTKTKLYKIIATAYPNMKIVLFDDSSAERDEAKKFGIDVYDGTNLLESVKAVYHIE